MKTTLAFVLAVLMFTAAAEDTKVYRLMAVDGNVTGYGTAFYVSKTTLLTAAHNVEGAKKLLLTKGGKQVECKVLKKDVERDVCLIESVPNDSWYEVLGFGEISTVAFPAGRGPKESTGTVVKYEMKLSFASGSSGAPILWNGKVIGMGVEHRKGDETQSFCVAGNVLKEFVTK